MDGHKWVDGRVGGQICMYGCKDECIDGWIGGWMDVRAHYEVLLC